MPKHSQKGQNQGKTPERTPATLKAIHFVWGVFPVIEGFSIQGRSRTMDCVSQFFIMSGRVRIRSVGAKPIGAESDYLYSPKSGWNSTANLLRG